MEKEDTVIEKLGRYVVISILGSIVLLLTIFSMFSTSGMNFNEQSFYIPDNPWKHLLVFILFIIAIGYAYKVFNNQNVKKCKIILWVLAVIAVVVCIYWVVIAQIQPGADQEIVFDIATQMHNGDYSSFQLWGYANVYPHQNGIIVMMYVLSSIVGKGNFVGIQVLNIGALVVSVFCIYKTTILISKSDRVSVLTGFLLLSFLPLVFYITFVYGNLIGLAFSSIAILLEYKYFEDKKIKYIFFASICISLAYIAKTNYLITMIAMICVLLVDYLSKRDIKTILFIISLVGVHVLGSIGVTAFIEHKTGLPVSKGIPMTAWIAMGLQEGPFAPGWFNTYPPNVYTQNNNDYEATQIATIDSIKASVKNFLNNPVYFKDFFYQKIASQWNNPTFQCFWINREAPVKFMNSENDNDNPLFEYLNIVQNLILLGVLANIFLNHKKVKIHHLIFAIVFIGGFLFHLLWEAKGQYTLTYFVLLIPYAALGYNSIIGVLVEVGEKSMSHSRGFTKSLMLDIAYSKVGVMIMALIIIVGIFSVLL